MDYKHKIKFPTMYGMSLHYARAVVSFAEQNHDAIAERWNEDKLNQMISLVNEYRETMTKVMDSKLMDSI